MVDEHSERIPLTLVAWESVCGIITLVFQEVGVSTIKLGSLGFEDRIFNVAGPLGNCSDIKNYGNVAMVCGGLGTAAAYPIAKGLRDKGNRVTSIIGARTKNLLILEDEMQSASDELYISTDDGSKGHHGYVSDVLKNLIQENREFDVVYAVGPPLMMSAVSEVTRPYGIKTVVSLNPIMVCGLGMCGSCRVSVGDETKFACVDGPEFDAHQVNFKELIQRLRSYSNEEKSALQLHQKIATCACQKH